MSNNKELDFKISPIADTVEKAKKPLAKTSRVKRKRKEEKFSKLKLMGGLVVLFVLGLLFAQIILADRYEMTVQVVDDENHMGINPLPDKLDFGDLSRNVNSSRFVALKNESNSERYILVWQGGEIANMVKVSNKSFSLGPGEETKVEFNILVPPSAETKRYDGKAMIFKLPKFF